MEVSLTETPKIQTIQITNQYTDVTVPDTDQKLFDESVDTLLNIRDVPVEVALSVLSQLSTLVLSYRKQIWDFSVAFLTTF